MRDQTRAAPGRFQRLSGAVKLCRLFCRRLLAGRPRAPAGLDARTRCDIGYPGDGLIGVSDVRAAFDRKLLESGQPWP
ncbi:MAG: hypothetical protein KUA43_02740 [Hoeflea sp.]|uniref:hypothetical protein n=1 Tax=Hoeflea sp. TaxID=1940281 RepID=UPI001D6326D0|nr:hypothetical protein [Hoeflea sp.]MBU4529846.1 hypothetical protein [Alphaproteobacteria bacterium]MBU4547133.1 hypothetical protein [Alphaproteobacteria bacterium]MBU4548746.1 hypothetical protein [Alphaproteobacteria bacterium]MBV1722339.1 hypothetical protein [Hoeflea sp.]MBV1762504.1 hypothetical protein [Hoeflea sp.]